VVTFKDWKPLGKNLIVRIVPAEERKSPGGLFLAAEKLPDTLEADVVSIGDEIRDISPGDRVYLPYAYLLKGDARYLIVKEKEILAVNE
jgi:co-chaperonin GroES (HSP10)